MKKALQKIERKNLYYTDSNGAKVYGKNDKMSGENSALYGDCTWLKGDFDQCEISIEDREKIIDIADLIFQE